MNRRFLSFSLVCYFVVYRASAPRTFSRAPLCIWILDPTSAASSLNKTKKKKTTEGGGGGKGGGGKERDAAWSLASSGGGGGGGGGVGGRIQITQAAKLLLTLHDYRHSRN